MVTHRNINVDKVVGFDLDGVIVDHTKMKQQIAKRYGFNLSFSEVQSDRIRELIPKDIRGKIQDELYCDHSSQPLFADALRVLLALRDSGMPLFLISRRRNDRSRKMAREILVKNKLYPEVFDEDNIYFVNSPEEKNEAAKRLGVTYYIDDETGVLQAMPAVLNRFIFDPFDNIKNPSIFQGTKNWKEIERELL